MARRRGIPVANPSRYRLGDFWLEPRPERAEWCIAWYDGPARTRRRRSTGIRYSGEVDPPVEAQKALAEHFAASSKPAEKQPAAVARVSDLLTIWQRDHVAKLNDPARYAYSVQHLLRFFEHERKAGRVRSGVTVADINKDFVDRFIRFRKGEGVGGDTISRDLAALRGSLNHAWREELIATVPFVKEVASKEKAKPRELTYTPEQIAAHLEAAYRREDRRHVFLYDLIALSTLGRSEAILELDRAQLRNGLIFFLDDEEEQTSKRRSIVPIAKTLAPHLADLPPGRVIQYRAPRAPRSWADPAVPEYFTREVDDIGKAFEACLIDAGICRVVTDAAGEPVMLPARAKLGETEPRPKLRGIGTPNTLRHTIITEMHARGIAEGQIDTAAGHAPIGTNKRNYRHLRPDYLGELMAGIEDFWNEVGRFTQVHRRTQSGPKVVSLAAARGGAS